VASLKSFKPILVTGGAKRIGLAIAQRFAGLGHPVIIHASPRTAEAAEVETNSLVKSGFVASSLIADLSKVEETASLIAQASQIYGPLETLVNNASVFEIDAAENFDFNLYEMHMAVNLRAPVLLASDFYRSVPKDYNGSIINIIDQRVWRLNPQYFSYTLAKSALWTATQTMAQAFAPHVRVNAVGPGPVFPNTALGEKEFIKEYKAIPLAQSVDVASIVDAVIYLSNARSVTGQMIAVDGGQHLSWQTPDIL